MDWRSVIEKYSSQLGWLALAGVALLAVKKDDKWPPDINYGGSSNPDDLDSGHLRKVKWNFEGKQQPQSYPARIDIDVGGGDSAPVKIIPTNHFKEQWIDRHAFVENDSLGLIGRFPSMALMGISMTFDKVAGAHKHRLGGTEVEPKLSGRVKYTGTRVRKPRMTGGSGRLSMPFHESIILFEVYRFDNDSFEMELINVLPREGRGKFDSQYTEMSRKSWPDNARVDPISADPTEVPRPTYGMWIHEPITPKNMSQPSSVEWLEGDHSQGGNFSLKQWKKAARTIGISTPSSRPPKLEVDKVWKNMNPSERKSLWDNLCRACPSLLSSAQGEAIGAIEGKMRKKENKLKAQQTLLAWGQPQVQKYVDQNCWI